MQATVQKSASKYRWQRALRPFSMPVSLTTCLLGISLAAQAERLQPLNAVLVLIAGLLLQAGVNLVNDAADLDNPLIRVQLSHSDVRAIRNNYRWGLASFLCASILGLLLAWIRDWWLLALGALGLAGALLYTGAPVNYKSRGLGVFLVFWLMGEFMVVGAAWASGAEPSSVQGLLALPLSFLVAALLLANELRDCDEDRRLEIKTLSVRIGFSRARGLYLLLISSAFISLLLLIANRSVTNGWLPILSFSLAIRPLRLLFSDGNLRPLPPLTARLLLALGLTQILGIWLTF